MSENLYKSPQTPLEPRRPARRSPLFTVLLVVGGLFLMSIAALVAMVMSVEMSDTTIILPANDQSNVPADAQ